MTGGSPGFSVLVRLVGGGLVAATVACSPVPAPGRGADLQPASAGLPPAAARAVGCWSLSWSLDPAPGGSPPQLPDSVQLRDGVLFGSTERLVSPATAPEGRSPTVGDPVPWETRLTVNRWWIEGETVRIRFSGAESETWDVGLALSGDGLEGSAEREAGLRSGRDTPISVKGERIACDRAR